MVRPYKDFGTEVSSRDDPGGMTLPGRENTKWIL